MDALEQWLDTLYDGDEIEIENTINLTRSKLVELFDHYKTLVVGVDRTTPMETMSPAASATRGGAMSLLKVRRMSYNTSSASGIESELTRYLNQPIVEYDEEDESFDQLVWWRSQESKYPVLSVMARDILTVPVSTVASEAAFSAGGRVISEKRGSLKPDTVEALICLKDWQLAEQRMQQAEQESKLAKELANLKISRPSFIEDSDPEDDPIPLD